MRGFRTSCSILKVGAIALLGMGLCVPAACAQVPQKVGDNDVIVRPQARVETDSMPHTGDSADDPAIWIHPSRPELSMILGTDKQGGLHAYNMDGSRRQVVSEDSHPNNVDVLYGFKLGGRTVDLAVASTRAPLATGVKVWIIDPQTRMLRDVTEGRAIRVLGGTAPYGICGYQSARAGQSYFVVTSYSGQVEQYALREAEGGKITAGKVRSIKLGSIAEGCVADHELGVLYIAEEKVGIWRFAAEPDGGNSGTLVARIGDHGLAADVEGLAIYAASGGKGYLIASSQGNNRFKVYAREGENRFVCSIDPRAGKIDDVSDTDGIAVTNRPTSAQFPKGLLIVQDGANAGGNQNFKMYGWEDIAEGRLLIDTMRER